MTVQLVDYPLFDTAVIAPDHTLLDALATAYLASPTDAAPEIERFLFGDLPVQVFGRIFAGASAADTPGLLWTLHLSGYYGGRWLRGEIAAAQPGAMLVGFSLPPTPEQYAATMGRAQTALDVVPADDTTSLAYALESLLDGPPATGGGEPVRGLTDTFGYNLGYLLEILATPPEGIVAGERFRIDCSGLFGCRYASPRLGVLQDLADVQAALASGESRYAALATELLPIQEAAVPRGRSVWSSGLSVQGFPQASYDQLLDVSSSFLETVQATALTMVRAIAESAAPSARRGALRTRR